MRPTGPTISPWNLSVSEARALDAVVERGCNKSAASALGLSFATISNRMSLAKEKMAAPNRGRVIVMWALWRKENQKAGE